MAHHNGTWEFVYFWRDGVFRQEISGPSMKEAAARLHAVVDGAITIFDYKKVR